MAEYNKIAEGVFTTTAVATPKFINLPFLPTSFEIWNKTKWAEAPSGAATPQYAIGFADDPAGKYYGNSAVASSSSAALSNITGTSGGFSFINAGTYQYGPTVAISGIVASTGVVTTSSAHGLLVGDTVLLYGTTGELQISGILTTVTAVGSSTTFTIGNIPTSGFGANATAGFVKKLLYADLYVPFANIITAVSTGTTTTITTSINHSFVVGQELYFIVPPQWGMTQLDSQNYLQQNFVPQRAYVISIPNPNQVVVSINSTSYTPFSFPTSPVAAQGLTFAQIIPAGDQNTGYLAPGGIPPLPITIPGSFYANTRKGVLIGATLLPNSGDTIRWRAIFPDMTA